MRIDILTLFPEMCETVMSESIIGRARRSEKVEIVCTNIRNFAGNKHNKVDDMPYGGGMGMIMAADPIYNCYKSLVSETEEKPRVIYMSPKGEKFTQEKARELSRLKRVMLICGHYEGVDERVRQCLMDEELSIGDYVLTNGAIAASVVTDAVVRLLPGALGNDESSADESFSNEPLLEYPQFTRPEDYKGMRVPEILLSGNHQEIDAWRLEQRVLRTVSRRPDLL